MRVNVPRALCESNVKQKEAEDVRTKEPSVGGVQQSYKSNVYPTGFDWRPLACRGVVGSLCFICLGGAPLLNQPFRRIPGYRRERAEPKSTRQRRRLRPYLYQCLRCSTIQGFTSSILPCICTPSCYKASHPSDVHTVRMLSSCSSTNECCHIIYRTIRGEGSAPCHRLHVGAV